MQNLLLSCFRRQARPDTAMKGPSRKALGEGKTLGEGKALLTARASRACHVHLCPVGEHLDLLRGEAELLGLGVT